MTKHDYYQELRQAPCQTPAKAYSCALKRILDICEAAHKRLENLKTQHPKTQQEVALYRDSLVAICDEALSAYFWENEGALEKTYRDALGLIYLLIEAAKSERIALSA